MYVMYLCIDYMHAKFQVNWFENGFHIVQKLRKACPKACPYVKFSSSLFDKNIQHRKMKIAPLNSPSHSPSKQCFFFVAKITSLKFSPSFTGISQIQVLNFKLTLTSHLTYLKK